MAGDFVIDIHSHLVPTEYSAYVRSRLDKMPAQFAQSLPIRVLAQPTEQFTSADRRLLEMDEAGINVSVLSIPPPGIYLAPPADRPFLARAVNDELLELASRHADRFNVLLLLPLDNVDQSIAELERVALHPKARGLILYTTTGERPLDDPLLEPVYVSASEFGLPALAHPAVEPLSSAWGDWLLSASLAPMFSSSLGVARVVLSGMLDRLPEFTLIVPHLGGTLPYLAQRLDDFGNGSAQHEFSWYLRERLFFDTCSLHPGAFRCSIETCGIRRHLLGTDHPARGPLQRAIDHVAEVVSDEVDRRAVLGATASAWFAP
jgi:aminocarboxymuconate-semialdehyde decarboxylase